MLKTINSYNNSTLKYINTLYQKKHRDAEQRFIIEGIKLITEAIRAQAVFFCIVVEEEFLQANLMLISTLEQICDQIYIVKSTILKSISDVQNSQGILAIIEYLSYDSNEIFLNERNGTESLFMIALDHLQDPGNMGTIIRTADAAGVKGVLFSEGTVDIYNSKVLRSTMGSLFHIPIYQTTNLSNTILALQNRGCSIVASHLLGSNFYKRTKNTQPIILVIGNESKGISPEIISISNYIYKLPMIGEAESLNASIAAGIMIYDFLRESLMK